MKLFCDFNLLAAGWWWNSWCLVFVVCVRCDRQQSSWCEEERCRPVGVHCPSSLVWGSPRWFGSSRVGPGSVVRVCRPYPHRAGVLGSWVAEGETAGSECRCLAPPPRVSEFTDDVISRVHLHLCLLDVRFIAQSSVKVDAQTHWCCCVWESGTVPHYIQFSFGFSVP